METLKNLFVYGTLMRGEVNHNVIEGCRFISEATTFKGYSMFDLGEIPIITDDAEVSQIKGELFRVTEDTLREIDDLERSLCKRVEAPVVIHRSGAVKAWFYVSTDDKGGTLVNSGKWRE